MTSGNHHNNVLHARATRSHSRYAPPLPPRLPGSHAVRRCRRAPQPPPPQEIAVAWLVLRAPELCLGLSPSTPSGKLRKARWGQSLCVIPIRLAETLILDIRMFVIQRQRGCEVHARDATLLKYCISFLYAATWSMIRSTLFHHRNVRDFSDDNGVDSARMISERTRGYTTFSENIHVVLDIQSCRGEDTAEPILRARDTKSRFFSQVTCTWYFTWRLLQ